MKKHCLRLAAAALIAAMTLSSCTTVEKPAQPKFTQEQRDALFPADLGPATVDVSNYPSEHQTTYRWVATQCSSCHTLARVINSPYIEETTWRRYLYRMHGKTKAKFDDSLVKSEAEAKRVVAFLAYDSRQRKVKKAQEFMRQQEELKALFAEAKAEKERLQMETDAKNGQSAPYVGSK